MAQWILAFRTFQKVSESAMPWFFNGFSRKGTSKKDSVRVLVGSGLGPRVLPHKVSPKGRILCGDPEFRGGDGKEASLSIGFALSSSCEEDPFDLSFPRPGPLESIERGENFPGKGKRGSRTEDTSYERHPGHMV